MKIGQIFHGLLRVTSTMILKRIIPSKRILFFSPTNDRNGELDPIGTRISSHPPLRHVNRILQMVRDLKLGYLDVHQPSLHSLAHLASRPLLSINHPVFRHPIARLRDQIFKSILFHVFKSPHFQIFKPVSRQGDHPIFKLPPPSAVFPSMKP